MTMRCVSAGNLAWLSIHVSVNIYCLPWFGVVKKLMQTAAKPLALCFVVYDPMTSGDVFERSTSTFVSSGS